MALSSSTLLIKYNGPYDPIDYGFYNELTQGFDVDVLSATSTRIVIENPSTGAITEINGFGLPLNPEISLSGTVTGFTTYDPDGNQITAFSGVSWDFATLINAMIDLQEYDDDVAFNGLMDSQPITVDLSDAVGGFDLSETFDEYTQDITIIGSDFGESLQGGLGDDTINPGTTTNDERSDVIYASEGDDTIVLSDVVPFSGSLELVYERQNASISVVIDGDANTGSIASLFGTDTLIDPAKALNWDTDGFGIWGSDLGDSFTIDGGADSWITVQGGQGADSYDLTLSSIVRLSFRRSWDNDATQGAQVNLASGVIANDGFGNAETVTLTPGSGQIELMGTAYADHFVGSAGNDRFILNGGNDTVDGGAGFDTVRYDRSEYSNGVTVDLAAGTTTGTWKGIAFTDSLLSIENIRGSDFNDNITGGGGNDFLDGREGNDTVLGAGGNDTIFGDTGNDLLGGGAGNDVLFSESGDNTIYGGAGNDSVEGGIGDDLIFGGGNGTNHLLGNEGNDTITAGSGGDLIGGGADNDTVYGGAGNDTLYGGTENDLIGGGAGNDRIFGEEGNDTLYLGLGNDFAGGGAGNDLIYGGAGNNTIYGGTGNDSVQGGNGSDVIIGGGDGANRLYGNGGNDVITAGAGSDFLAGGTGNDRIFGGDGDNTIYLGTGNDFVGGGAGNDVIFAGAGSNTIYGGTGNDMIHAGTGRDVIASGPGADVFVFSSAAHAGIGTGRDVITDFTVGVDHIDLSAMNMSFIGNAAFSGTAGELRYFSGFVVGDVDGDGINDFAIQLSGAPALTAGDFIL